MSTVPRGTIPLAQEHNKTWRRRKPFSVLCEKRREEKQNIEGKRAMRIVLERVLGKERKEEKEGARALLPWRSQPAACGW